MERLTKIIMWIGITTFIVLIAFLCIPLFSERSWWWFLTPLIIVLISIIFGIVVLIIVKRKKSKIESEEKKTTIDVDMADKLADRIFKEEYADMFTDTEKLVAHEGGLGKEKTTIFK